MEEQLISRLNNQIGNLKTLDNVLMLVLTLLFAFCMILLLNRKKGENN